MWIDWSGFRESSRGFKCHYASSASSMNRSGSAAEAMPPHVAPSWSTHIAAADLSFPIILSSDGRVMDGMHRVAQAALLGHETIAAVQFASDLEPDFVDVQPEDLPYEDTFNEAPRIA